VEFCKPYRAIGQSYFSNSLLFSPGFFRKRHSTFEVHDCCDTRQSFR
jgi:hypothetical protein